VAITPPGRSASGGGRLHPGIDDAHTGTGVLVASSGSAAADAVLQAITMPPTCMRRRKETIWRAKPQTISLGLRP